MLPERSERLALLYTRAGQGKDPRSVAASFDSVLSRRPTQPHDTNAAPCQGATIAADAS